MSQSLASPGHDPSATGRNESILLLHTTTTGREPLTGTASPHQAVAMSQPRQRLKPSLSDTTPPTAPAQADTETDDEWDYSETEWWGWVILAATWAVFVVGMGSCLGVWTWAWDIGETPYAPPDLEDDPTLPITGYYPALMVCTAVMAWVWVVVAWVGMKYFRHAKVVVDDG